MFSALIFKRHISYRAAGHLSGCHPISSGALDLQEFCGHRLFEHLATRVRIGCWAVGTRIPGSECQVRFRGIGFSGRPRFPIPPGPRDLDQGRTRFQSCGAEASVSYSPRSGGGCVAVGRAPGRSPWQGSRWRWTAGSWKG